MRRIRKTASEFDATEIPSSYVELKQFECFRTTEVHIFARVSFPPSTSHKELTKFAVTRTGKDCLGTET